MRILTPKDSLMSLKNGIFLAGPATRSKETLGWREEMMKILQDQEYSGDVLNPENIEYGELGENAYSIQTKWEQDAMKLASYIIFWIPRTEKNPGLTTNIELGQWLEHPRSYVGWPPGAINNRYIAERCRQCGKRFYSTMEELVSDIVIEQNKPTRIFFTSDTHFGAKRTLELSRRPFKDVEDMDLTLCSNWNKTVRNNDVLFHLGDFGDFDQINHLNGNIYFVKGNYEKDMEIPKDVFKEILPNGKKVQLNNRQYRLVHEPLNGSQFYGSDEDFYLFGHIHRTCIVKRNGVNVGTDCYRFTPISLDEIEFLRDGVEKYFDQNVFTDKVVP